jgi:hypothetical protein
MIRVGMGRDIIERTGTGFFGAFSLNARGFFCWAGSTGQFQVDLQLMVISLSFSLSLCDVVMVMTMCLRALMQL